MEITKYTVRILLHLYFVQMTLSQTIFGITALAGEPPSSLVMVDPKTCDVRTISLFDNGGLGIYYLYDNAGWVDKNGFYYSNFLTTTNWWGPGKTFSFNLNHPDAGWNNFGTTTVTSFASSSQNVYAIGTGQTQCTGLIINASNKSQETVGSFPSNYQPSDVGSTTVDGKGLIWSFFTDMSTTNDYWIAMDSTTGQIATRSQITQGFPFPVDIHWDTTNSNFFSICRLGNYIYGICKVAPTVGSAKPQVYGSNITVTELFSGGFYSSHDRILYVQFFMDSTYQQANLVGFDVDSGDIVSNCQFPASTGGALLNMAVYSV